MKSYIFIFSLLFSLIGAFVVGCTSKNTILLEGNYLNSNAIPVSLILNTWGKPNFMNYNTDGSSEMEWHNIEPAALHGYPLIPFEKQERIAKNIKDSLRCSVRFYVNHSGKAESHALICYTVPQGPEILLSKK
ncbi:MAG: hypothetical protein ACRCV3_06065 [Desulfovibrionaceae bacterium]